MNYTHEVPLVATLLARTSPFGPVSMHIVALRDGLLTLYPLPARLQPPPASVDSARGARLLLSGGVHIGVDESRRSITLGTLVPAVLQVTLYFNDPSPSRNRDHDHDHDRDRNYTYEARESSRPALLPWAAALHRAAAYRLDRFYAPCASHAPLGRGHFAAVRRFLDRRTGLPVAVKTVPRARSTPRALRREAALARQLPAHPCVARARDVFETHAALHIVMDVADAGDVYDLVADLPAPLRRCPAARERLARHVVAAVLRALAHLHALGVVHRDVKPENVLLHGDRLQHVRLADFGLARRLGDAHDVDHFADCDSVADFDHVPKCLELLMQGRDPAFAVADAALGRSARDASDFWERGSVARQRCKGPRRGRRQIDEGQEPQHVDIVDHEEEEGEEPEDSVSEDEEYDDHDTSGSNTEAPMPDSPPSPGFFAQYVRPFFQSGSEKASSPDPFGSSSPPSPRSVLASPWFGALSSSSDSLHSAAGSSNDDYSLRSAVGTPSFCAPEIVRRRPYGRPVDVYAAGMLAVFVLTGTTPFEAGTTRDTLANVAAGRATFPPEWGGPTVSAAARDFVARLTARRPSARPTARQALRHPWLAEYGRCGDDDATEVRVETRCASPVTPPAPQRAGWNSAATAARRVWNGASVAAGAMTEQTPGSRRSGAEEARTHGGRGEGERDGVFDGLVDVALGSSDEEGSEVEVGELPAGLLGEGKDCHDDDEVVFSAAQKRVAAGDKFGHGMDEALEVSSVSERGSGGGSRGSESGSGSGSEVRPVMDKRALEEMLAWM